MKKLDTKNAAIRFRQVVEVKAAENGSLPTEIQLFKPGHWDTPWHGEFILNSQVFGNMIRNFEVGIRGRKENGLPIDREHYSDLGSAGWIKHLEDRGEDGLWGAVEWTKDGAEDLKNKVYKFFSPEWAPVYQDPERLEVFYEDVLCGGGLTNRPLFKDLEPIVASEEGRKDLTDKNDDNIIYLNNSERKSMKLEDILKKANDDVTDEEREFLTAHVEELTDEQKTQYELVKADDGEDDEEDKEEEKKDEAEADDADEEEEDEDEEEEAKKASEKQVTISASDLKILKKQAAEGSEALLKLKKKEANEKIESMLFNEKGGKFPPKMKKKLASFYMKLSEKQQVDFEEIVKELPEAKIFSSQGSDKEVVGGATAQFTKLANEKMKANEKMTFSQAIVEIANENPELAAEYDKETERKELVSKN